MPASAARPPRRRLRALLALASFGIAALLGECTLRITGGFRLSGLRLELTFEANPDAATQLQMAKDVVDPLVARTRRDGIDPAWLRTSPPPFPTPPESSAPLLPQPQWLLHYYTLNEVLLRAMWVKGQGLPMFPGIELPEQFLVFAPPQPIPHPRYRYPASTTLRTGLSTNAFGFRGRELAVDKPAGTVRIGFVGASTMVEAARLPHSAPELIEHWLSSWAAARGIDARFETLNAAREAIESPDIVAIVRDELLPLEVDYVVYYEGANQLQPATIAKHVQIDGAYTVGQPPAGLVGNYDDVVSDESTWLDWAAGWSAIARYLRSALLGSGAVAEPQKPAQRITLPPGFDGPEFPLARAGEVLECGAIARDLDAIAAACKASRAVLLPCTFAWLAHDGMTTHPVLGRNIHIHLDRAYWPLRYGTVRALADLQNSFFTAWARQHGAFVLDVSAWLPAEECLYIDAIHHTELGVRLKAWVMFCELTRLLERDLGAGKVPVADRHADGRHPNIGPVRVVTRTDLDAGR